MAKPRNVTIQVLISSKPGPKITAEACLVGSAKKRKLRCSWAVGDTAKSAASKAVKQLAQRVRSGRKMPVRFTIRSASRGLGNAIEERGYNIMEPAQGGFRAMSIAWYPTKAVAEENLKQLRAHPGTTRIYPEKA